MSDTFLNSQIAIIEGDIEALNVAIRFLLSNPTEDYTLNTSMSTQRVKRQNLSQLHAMRSALYEERDILKLRVCGRPQMSHAPNW